MKPGAQQRIIAAIHPARMAPYPAASTGNESKALPRYNWHTELTAAVQQMLGITEGVLRKAADVQLHAWRTHQGEGTEVAAYSPSVLAPWPHLRQPT